MQHNLLKKYEDEVNSNAVKQDMINHMKIELDQLNEAIMTKETQNRGLLKRLEKLDDLEDKIKTLLMDYEACKKKCKKYKAELRCFDEKFFDELEDLKYSFYESIKLNKHYERLLFNLKKEDLAVENSESHIKKKNIKNKVKFANNCERLAKNTTNNIHFDELKQSLESINRRFKESLRNLECNDVSTDETVNDSEVVSSFQDKFKFEGYLSDKDNSTPDYNYLIKNLTS